MAHGLVYIGSGMGGLAAFDATTGHVRWITPATAASSGSSPAVANGVVYLAEGRVYAFDAATVISAGFPALLARTTPTRRW